MENLTAYWSCMGVSTALTGMFFFFLTREDSVLCSGALRLAILETLLGAFLGLLCAKTGYFLVRINYLLGQGFGPFWISLKPDELLFFGGVGTGVENLVNLMGLTGGAEAVAITLLDVLVMFLLCVIVTAVGISLVHAVTARLKIEQIFKYYWTVVTGLAVISLVLAWYGM